MPSSLSMGVCWQNVIIAPTRVLPYQAVFNEIGHVKLLEDLVSGYFVGRATLNKTVLHLTGRFACLLREYGTSDSETLHADVIGEIELLRWLNILQFFFVH